MSIIMPVMIWMCALWFLGTVQTHATGNGTMRKRTARPAFGTSFSLGGHLTSSPQVARRQHILTEQWQDYVLANVITTNYLSILMALASKADFPLVQSPTYCGTYIQRTSSFRPTISSLANSIRPLLLNIYDDFRRMELILVRLPLQLKYTLLLIKRGNEGNIRKYLPLLLEAHVDVSEKTLEILKKPKLQMNRVRDLLVELDALIRTVDSADAYIRLQVEDVKIQWSILTDLFTQLAIESEATTDSLLRQFHWLLRELLRTHGQSIDMYRELIVDLLLPKVLEMDRSIDLITMVCDTFMDISVNYTNDELIDNSNLLLLPNEQERRKFIRQARYDLPPRAVQFARLALKRHTAWLRRDQVRQTSIEEFLNPPTLTDLMLFLSFLNE